MVWLFHLDNDEFHLETIYFDGEFWNMVKDKLKLDMFYLNYFYDHLLVMTKWKKGRSNQVFCFNNGLLNKVKMLVIVHS